MSKSETSPIRASEAKPVPGSGGIPKERPKWQTYSLYAIAAALVLFVALNFQKVEINYIFGTADAPLVIALLVAGGLGALIGWLVPKVRSKD